MNTKLNTILTIIVFWMLVPIMHTHADTNQLRPDQQKQAQSLLRKLQAIPILVQDKEFTKKEAEARKKQYLTQLKKVFGKDIEYATAQTLLSNAMRNNQVRKADSKAKKIAEQIDDASALSIIMTILGGLLIVGFILWNLFKITGPWGVLLASVIIIIVALSWADGQTGSARIYYGLVGFLLIPGAMILGQFLLFDDINDLDVVITVWATLLSAVWFFVTHVFGITIFGALTLIPFGYVVSKFAHIPLTYFLDDEDPHSTKKDYHFDNRLISVGLVFLTMYLLVYLYALSETVRLFGHSLLYLGGLCFYLTESTISIKWFTDPSEKRFKYVAHQIIFPGITIIMLLIGIRFNINGFIGFGASFLTVYVIEKIVEVVHATKRKSLSLILVGVLLWGVVTFFEYAPQYIFTNNV